MSEIENKANEFISWFIKRYEIKSKDEIACSHIKALYVEVVKAKEVIYKKDGNEYRKLKRDEVIKAGAMMSIDNGELYPITNRLGDTIGSTPAEFSDERDFYNLIDVDNFFIKIGDMLIGDKS